MSQFHTTATFATFISAVVLYKLFGFSLDKVSLCSFG